MAYAFLFLTYDNIIKDYNIDNINIYIHAKYPEKVNKKYKKYIIKNLIKQTDWCEYSIVKATINLLKEALSQLPEKITEAELHTLLRDTHSPLSTALFTPVAPIARGFTLFEQKKQPEPDMALLK